MDLMAALRRPRLTAAAACFLLGAGLLVGGLLTRPDSTPAAPMPYAALAEGPLLPAPAEGGAPTELVVYISGAVLRPDVYTLAPGARVKDAVLAAGGLGPEAAAEQINLAEPLSDAAHIHIPTLAAVAAPLQAAPSSDGPARLDLNTATEVELEELPGIGATLAARIVARRSEIGPYTSIEQLRDVSGVGAKLYAQIEPLVMVGP